MKLSDWEEKLVDDIDIIFSGGYNEKFNEEQIEGVKQLSFLLKHIEIDDNSIIFSYDSYKFIVQGIDELGLISTYSEFTENLMDEWAKDHIIFSIKNSDEFKTAYKLFVRDFKIDKIIKK